MLAADPCVPSLNQELGSGGKRKTHQFSQRDINAVIISQLEERELEVISTPHRLQSFSLPYHIIRCLDFPVV